MQLHFEPRYAPGFEPLINEFAKTKVIIDHLGRPFQGTPAEHEVVLRWSKLDNTIMKLSAIPDQRTYPHRDIGPIIRQLTDAWGAATRSTAAASARRPPARATARLSSTPARTWRTSRPPTRRRSSAATRRSCSASGHEI